jgi:hypothetical protein
MLNNFGQTFKDNGYQLGNDRDAPNYQQPAYWPIMFRVTPQWHRESNNRVAVPDPLLAKHLGSWPALRRTSALEQNGHKTVASLATLTAPKQFAETRGGNLLLS